VGSTIKDNNDSLHPLGGPVMNETAMYCPLGVLVYIYVLTARRSGRHIHID